MKIFVMKISDINDEIFDYLLDEIPVSRKIKVLKYYNKKDRIRTLLGEILIKEKLSQHLNIPRRELIFGYNYYGKPYLLSHDNIHFNISHSHEIVTVCYSNMAVGIDIEFIRSIDIPLIISNFTQLEKNYILNLPSQYQKQAFFEIWTRKESLIKNIGAGLSLSLDSFSVVHYHEEEKFLTNELCYQGVNYYFNTYYYSDKYILVICSGVVYPPASFEEVSFNELLVNR
ncbi:4'-phosphopantetheinyl transferase family protein [Jeotgalibacillus campisalis]|uniref:Uncharacterized protein n=1 Tax=Jeotgalibacillus campisalis TaxID=220754 RepID=A0A0C2W4Z3_9BACL|nr:4'-phosphopantetheinyl transferase superfamily protein [Jeotgalibacillus campisalis]KIL51083.1 hypothetical protein KR50_09640 [Jeotgalibacillus campisalis]